MTSRSVYESFFESSLNALVLTKTDGAILEANKAACDMFGYSKDEFKKQFTTTIIDKTDPAFAEIFSGQHVHRSVKGVLTGIRSNGEKFPFKIALVTLNDENGENITSIVGTDISEQIKQQERLTALLDETKSLHQKEEDSRILMESVLDSITDGFFIVDRNWQVIFWNKAAEMILGKSEQELIGKNVWEAFPDLAFLRQHMNYKALFHENKSIRFREYFPQYKVWADVSAYPSEKNISVYFKDVTEVKNLRTQEWLEREVLEMNARPDSILEQTIEFYLREIQNMHDGMLCSVQRLKGNRLYNWSAPEVSQKYLSAIEGIEMGEGVGCCGTAAFRKEKVIVSDIETDPLWQNFLNLAREEGLKACWSFPLINSHQDVLGTFAIYYKKIKSPTHEEESTMERAKNLLLIIIENKIAVEAVKSSNRNYDMVAMATNDAIWDWDVYTNEVVRTGQGLKVLFGYDPAEAAKAGNFWNIRIHPEDIQRVIDKQAVAIADTTQMYWEDEYRFLKSNGKYAYVFDKGYIIRDETGKAVRLIGATRDITERKEHEALLLELNNRLKQRADELAASNVELERFAYIASHDMQEPLRMITSFLQLFKKKYEDQIDETAEQYIHYAVDGADRMKKLILDLLEYSRVGSNKDDMEEIDTNVLVKEVIDVFIGRIDEINATVTADPLPVITANKTQLFQLFQNLVGNALKYHSGEMAHVQISGKEEPNHYEFSVRDNGIGIKPIFFEKIFILFQRLHHRNEYSGTGIGLAICKKIVEKHNGKIWVESEPGKGSCFYFTISKSFDPYR
ncbi:MAG: PAS domain S-box protein [Bacteroidota bacterium]